MMHKDDNCTRFEDHPEALCAVRAKLPDDETLLSTSELFHLIGDLSRLKIVVALLITELCVCDLSDIVGISPSAISHQLRLLRQARLVTFRREGKNAYYFLRDDHVCQLVRQTLDHVMETKK